MLVILITWTFTYLAVALAEKQVRWLMVLLLVQGRGEDGVRME